MAIFVCFQTRAADSVLFFGCSLTQYNHLAVSLHNASLHVSVVFVDQHNYDELWLAIGTELNDNRLGQDGIAFGYHCWGFYSGTLSCSQVTISD